LKVDLQVTSYTTKGTHICKLDQNMIIGEKEDVRHEMHNTATQKALDNMEISPKKNGKRLTMTLTQNMKK
jgi:hypothetical protein